MYSFLSDLSHLGGEFRTVGRQHEIAASVRKLITPSRFESIRDMHSSINYIHRSSAGEATQRNSNRIGSMGSKRESVDSSASKREGRRRQCQAETRTSEILNHRANSQLLYVVEINHRPIQVSAYRVSESATCYYLKQHFNNLYVAFNLANFAAILH